MPFFKFECYKMRLKSKKGNSTFHTVKQVYLTRIERLKFLKRVNKLVSRLTRLNFIIQRK